MQKLCPLVKRLIQQNLNFEEVIKATKYYTEKERNTYLKPKRNSGQIWGVKMSGGSKEVPINWLLAQVQNFSLSSRAGGRKGELWTWVECQFFWWTLHNSGKDSFPSNFVQWWSSMVFLFQTLYTSSGSPVSVAGNGCCCPWVDIESGQKTVATLLLENPKGSPITQYSGQALQGDFRTKAPPGMVTLMQFFH